MAIINISRQPYSCGNEIARELAKKLNYKLIDKFLINNKIKDFHCNFSDEIQGLASEKEPGFFKNFFKHPQVYNSLLQSILFEEASNGNVVIKGRGGQYILHNPNVLNIRIISPVDARRAFLEKKEAVNPKVAARLLDKKDHERENFIKYLFKEDVSNTDSYDLVFNHQKFGTDVIISAIEGYADHIDKNHPLSDTDKYKFKCLSLEKRVEATIRKKLPDVVGLKVTCEKQGDIKITGFVENEIDRNELFKLAKSCRGVESIDNDLSTIRLQKI